MISHGLSGTKWSALIFATSLGGCLHFDRPAIPAVIGGTSGPTPAPANYTLASYDADLKNYTDTKNPQEKQPLRDKLVYSVVAEIDYAFGNFESRLFLDQGAFRVGSDFLSLGLAAGSTITPAARTKTVLSALIAGTTGTSLSLDKNFFQQQTIQALVSSMEANRDGIKTNILKQLTLGVDKYPFEAARSDLIKYYFAGTLVSGLQRIHQDAAAAAKTEGDKLEGTVIAKVTTEDLATAVTIDNILSSNNPSEADLDKVIKLFTTPSVLAAAKPATKAFINNTLGTNPTALTAAEKKTKLVQINRTLDDESETFNKTLNTEWAAINAKK